MPRFIISLCLSVFLLSACAGEKKATEEKPAEAKTEEAAETKAEAITAEMLAENYDLEAGKATFDQSCKSCHMMGVAGAPKHADKAAWADRLPQGMDVLVKKSIEGYTSKAGTMPARGGNPDLSDKEVADAVAFMVNELL